jgi:AmmeMemoRadiSam system protein A
MDPFVELAGKAVEEYVRRGRRLDIPPEIPEEMRRRAGAFVCLKISGYLRGCIGTFLPAGANLYEEVAHNAVSAATADPRFPPVRADELADIVYTVDILSEPQRISDLSELDPKIYGVIVSQGYRRGLLLPDLEGVDTVEEQLKITKMKAGINPCDTDVEIDKFFVERHS